MNRIRSAVVAFAGIWSVHSCAAAISDTLPESVRACMTESDDTRRLACFDRETARLADKPAPVTASAAPAPSAPVAAASSASVQQQATPASPPQLSDEEKFGYRGSLAREEFDRRKAEGVDQLTAKVVEVSAAPHGQFVAKLDNGQVWQQKMSERVRVKAGDEVTIRRASFGSFMLVTPTGKSTRVTRIE